MAITALPTPPSRSDPTNFASRADGFLGALPTFATEANALATDVNNKQVAAASSASAAANSATNANNSATSASNSASAAATSATNSEASAVASAASAAAAAALAGAFTGTSTSSLDIGLGNKTIVTQAGEQYTAGIYMIVVSTADASKYMFGQVVSYSGTSLVLNVQATGGSGTYASWNISLAGVQGAPGTGITPQAIGFSMTGGTVAKSLVVDQDLTVSSLSTVARTGSYSDLLNTPAVSNFKQSQGYFFSGF